jgi:deoxyribodipyrimidine photo-lyase
MKTKVNIVWLKRDLRTQDHAPLKAAEEAGIPYVIFYLFEPSLLAYPDSSDRHLRFVYHALKEMNRHLEISGRQVRILYGEALEVSHYLHEIFDIQKVYSYQESGIQLTWNRDKAVSKFLQSQNIPWFQFQRDAVVRGLKNRVGWDVLWQQTMEKEVLANSYTKETLPSFETPFQFPKQLQKKLEKYPSEFQPAGETYAWKYLRSFAEERGHAYHRQISKPEASRTACGRISPYLAWGNLSVKQALHYLYLHPSRKSHKRAFQGILTRLKWHCHFIQKFEMECGYETLCVNKGYESLVRPLDTSKVTAWEKGQTGFPLVDACMRCLRATGWINFRMRAMLVSLLCHHLDQDWRTGTHLLARLFLDYEPGIHYTQFQMQAGTTGINTVRIYNPVKQSQEHDPQGAFIKKWVPELVPVPTAFVHEPWKMTYMDQVFCGFHLGEHYPLPIVDLQVSGKIAREKIWGHRKNLQVKKEGKRILHTHVRNPHIQK